MHSPRLSRALQGKSTSSVPPPSCFGARASGLLFSLFPVLNGVTMLFLMGPGDRVGLNELRGPFEIPFVFCGP